MISAGEASGDLHGAALALSARQIAPEMSFFGLGGDLMAEAGVNLAGHVSETAVMGLTEILGSLGKILAVRARLADLMRSQKPDALVLIDSPDFNFYLAKKAARLSIPVVYYVCPQVWAWRKSRLKFLAKYCARRAVIFPFEKDFYEANGVSADLVGHPLLDRLAAPSPNDKAKARKELNLAQDRPVLAILPGSRAALAKRLAPLALGAALRLLESFPGLQLAIPLAQSLNPSILERSIMAGPKKTRDAITIFRGRSPEVLVASDAALLASGTSTLEAAILKTPMAVAYKTSWLTFFLAKRLATVPFISMANLLLGRPAIPEFIQSAVTPENLAAAIAPLLLAGPERDKALADLTEAAGILGGPGASAKVVAIVAETIRSAKKARQ